MSNSPLQTEFLFCSFVDINPAIYQARDDDGPSTSLSSIAVSRVLQTVESPSPNVMTSSTAVLSLGTNGLSLQNTFTSDHTVMWSSSPHSQLSWETSLPLPSGRCVCVCGRGGGYCVYVVFSYCTSLDDANKR